MKIVGRYLLAGTSAWKKTKYPGIPVSVLARSQAVCCVTFYQPRPVAVVFVWIYFYLRCCKHNIWMVERNRFFLVPRNFPRKSADRKYVSSFISWHLTCFLFWRTLICRLLALDTAAGMTGNRCVVIHNVSSCEGMSVTACSSFPISRGVGCASGRWHNPGVAGKTCWKTCWLLLWTVYQNVNGFCCWQGGRVPLPTSPSLRHSRGHFWLPRFSVRNHEDWHVARSDHLFFFDPS